MNLNCPKCGSDGVRRVSLVYREGLSGVEAATMGFGLGLAAGGAGVGLFGSETKGVQQTALSQELAPPKRREPGKWVRFGALIGLLIFLGAFAEPGAHSIMNVLLGLAVGIPSARAWFKVAQWNQTELPRLAKEWEESFICTRCGHTFRPAE